MAEDPANDEGIKGRIAMLRLEHRDLDDAIAVMAASPKAEPLQLARLKKRKLALRDEIILLTSRTTPDIIA